MRRLTFTQRDGTHAGTVKTVDTEVIKLIAGATLHEHGRAAS